MPETEPRSQWDQLSDAAAFAFRIHAAQLRKGTSIPYLSHLMAVAALVLEHGGDEQTAIAGLLHDAIEDIDPAIEAEIAARFGARVAAVVRGCSDTDMRPKPPWRERKLAYLAHLESAGPDVLLVSAADKLHNARALLIDLRTEGPALFNRFNASAADTLWLYAALADVFQRRLPGPLSRELGLTVAMLRALALELGLDP